MNDLVLLIPKYCFEEQKYIADILLKDFLGLDFEIHLSELSHIEISRKGSNSILKVDNSFFKTAHKNWLSQSSLPDLPLLKWNPSSEGIFADLVDNEIPVIFGKPGFHSFQNQFELHLDIFGSSFFMLTCYEEAVLKSKDDHSRFPAKQSISFKEEYLDRPIVNEYVEILWECLKYIWPDLRRKEGVPKNFITCDVDWPIDLANYEIRHLLKRIVKKFFQLKPRDAFKSLKNFLLNFLGFEIEDEFIKNIHWIMDVNEKEGNKVAFYFIYLYTSPYDIKVDFYSNLLQNLFKEINDRGHEIGIHPGYNTSTDLDLLEKSFQSMRSIHKNAKLSLQNIGGRFHFLRWNAYSSPSLCEKMGMIYDSTLAYADKAGFRCGTCNDFRMYDLALRNALEVKQIPLIAMESTIISDTYEGLGYTDKSLARFKHLKKICYQYNGIFTLLWHNTHFNNKLDQDFYLELIKNGID